MKLFTLLFAVFAVSARDSTRGSPEPDRDPDRDPTTGTNNRPRKTSVWERLREKRLLIASLIRKYQLCIANAADEQAKKACKQ